MQVKYFDQYLDQHGYNFKCSENELGGYAILENKNSILMMDIGSSPSRKFSEKYFIHRTRQNFDYEVDDFDNMANNAIKIITNMVKNEINGRFDQDNQLWYIPQVDQIK